MQALIFYLGFGALLFIVFVLSSVGAQVASLGGVL